MRDAIAMYTAMKWVTALLDYTSVPPLYISLIQIRYVFSILVTYYNTKQEADVNLKLIRFLRNCMVCYACYTIFNFFWFFHLKESHSRNLTN